MVILVKVFDEPSQSLGVCVNYFTATKYRDLQLLRPESKIQNYISNSLINN